MKPSRSDWTIGCSGTTTRNWREDGVYGVKKDGYRYQFGWRVPGHYDHIHVGVKKLGVKSKSTDSEDKEDKKEKNDQEGTANLLDQLKNFIKNFTS